MIFPYGSIIKRRIEGFYGLIYNHMGIYIGQNTVIHFNGENKKANKAVLRKDKLEKFAAGYKVKLHAAPKNYAHGQAVCKKAEQLYKNYNNQYDNQYSFVFNNCEDFCVECFEVPYTEI